MTSACYGDAIYTSSIVGDTSGTYWVVKQVAFIRYDLDFYFDAGADCDPWTQC